MQFMPLTFLMALAFCAVHLFVGKLRFLERTPRSRWLSFAGGVAVAYVFLHILPELGSHAMTFEEETKLGQPIAEGWVYTLSLAGLALFYGLERALAASRDARIAAGGSDVPDPAICWLHIAALSLLMAIIAYLLNHREDPEPLGLALYFAAMTLHFVSADFGARVADPDHYDSKGRWVLVLATLGGWFFGLLVALPTVMVSCLFAFVAGAIVLLALKEELPEDRQSAFGPFLLGVVIYTALVLGETYLAAR